VGDNAQNMDGEIGGGGNGEASDGSEVVIHW
jgi:hypothetical protein